MVITESQLRIDTKEEVVSVLIEKAFGKAFKSDSYVFISHKHHETEFVYRLKDILERYGFVGYVDWEDKEMPLTTDGETALKLKERITGAKKFILIATEAAIDSKWCNWEVGFADAHKYEDNMALIPVKRDNGNYRGEEYLRIYPSLQIRSQKVDTGFEYYVRYPNGNEVSLRTWLTL